MGRPHRGPLRSEGAAVGSPYAAVGSLDQRRDPKNAEIPQTWARARQLSEEAGGAEAGGAAAWEAEAGWAAASSRSSQIPGRKLLAGPALASEVGDVHLILLLEAVGEGAVAIVGYQRTRMEPREKGALALPTAAEDTLENPATVAAAVAAAAAAAMKTAVLALHGLLKLEF